MLILLWVIGHRLSEDAVHRLISQACEEGLRTNIVAGVAREAEINDWVIKIKQLKGVFLSLGRTIRNKQPMRPGIVTFNLKTRSFDHLVIRLESFWHQYRR